MKNSSTEKKSGDQSRRFKERLARLLTRIESLTPSQLAEVEALVAQFGTDGTSASTERKSGDMSPHSKGWPRAPLHRLFGKGTVIVTAGTLDKVHYFRERESLVCLESELLSKAKQYDWQLEAWAVFSNHYHFVGHALKDARTLKPFLSHLHADTARYVNERDRTAGRQVWFNYWETELTFEKSYLARLNYVHQNAVRHGLVPVANQYRWCSAAWFERTASPAQVKTIYSFKTDRLKVVDEYEVLGVR